METEEYEANIDEDVDTIKNKPMKTAKAKNRGGQARNMSVSLSTGNSVQVPTYVTADLYGLSARDHTINPMIARQMAVLINGTDSTIDKWGEVRVMQNDRQEFLRRYVGHREFGAAELAMSGIINENVNTTVMTAFSPEHNLFGQGLTCYEWSKQLGLHLKDLFFHLDVDANYWAHKDLGELGYSDDHRSASGAPLTHSERLYTHLRSLYDPVKLNMPIEKHATYKLRDAVEASLKQFFPKFTLGDGPQTLVAAGNIVLDKVGLAEGLGAMQYGLSQDSDGNVVYVLPLFKNAGDVDGAPPGTVTLSISDNDELAAFNRGNYPNTYGAFQVPPGDNYIGKTSTHVYIGGERYELASLPGGVPLVPEGVTIKPPTLQELYPQSSNIHTWPFGPSPELARTNQLGSNWASGNRALVMHTMDSVDLANWLMFFSNELEPDFVYALSAIGREAGALDMQLSGALGDGSVSLLNTGGLAWDTLVAYENLFGTYNIQFNPANIHPVNGGPFSEELTSEELDAAWKPMKGYSLSVAEKEAIIDLSFGKLRIPSAHGSGGQILLADLVKRMPDKVIDRIVTSSRDLAKRNRRNVMVPANATPDTIAVGSSSTDSPLAVVGALKTMMMLSDGLYFDVTHYCPITDLDVENVIDDADGWTLVAEPNNAAIYDPSVHAVFGNNGLYLGNSFAPPTAPAGPITGPGPQVLNYYGALGGAPSSVQLAADWVPSLPELKEGDESVSMIQSPGATSLTTVRDVNRDPKHHTSMYIVMSESEEPSKIKACYNTGMVYTPSVSGYVIPVLPGFRTSAVHPGTATSSALTSGYGDGALFETNINEEAWRTFGFGSGGLNVGNIPTVVSSKADAEEVSRTISADGVPLWAARGGTDITLRAKKIASSSSGGKRSYCKDIDDLLLNVDQITKDKISNALISIGKMDEDLEVDVVYYSLTEGFYVEHHFQSTGVRTFPRDLSTDGLHWVQFHVTQLINKADSDGSILSIDELIDKAQNTKLTIMTDGLVDSDIGFGTMSGATTVPIITKDILMSAEVETLINALGAANHLRTTLYTTGDISSEPWKPIIPERVDLYRSYHNDFVDASIYHHSGMIYYPRTMNEDLNSGAASFPYHGEPRPMRPEFVREDLRQFDPLAKNIYHTQRIELLRAGRVNIDPLMYQEVIRPFPTANAQMMLSGWTPELIRMIELDASQRAMSTWSGSNL